MSRRRGLLTEGLPPSPSPPPLPRDPAAIGAYLHQRRWLPTRPRLPLPPAARPRPPAAGRSRRPPPHPRLLLAHRPLLVRQGHPPGLQPHVWRAADLDQVDGRPVSPANGAARRLSPPDRPGPGRGPTERGRLPRAFGGRPWFTDRGHQGHLHVGFAGPTQPGEAR